jgi:hypothetical protein
MGTLDDEIRERVAACLGGEITIEALEDWFVGRSWDDRTMLVVQLDHLLAERDATDEQEFLVELRALASTVRIGAVSQVSSGTSAMTLRPRPVITTGSETITRRLEFAGTQSAAARE